MTRSQIGVLSLSLITAGCIFGAGDPPDSNEPGDDAGLDTGSTQPGDMSEGRDVASSPDVNDAPDVTPPVDLGNPGFNCDVSGDPQRPQLLPTNILDGESVIGDLSFTAFRPQGEPAVALGYLSSTNGPTVHVMRVEDDRVVSAGAQVLGAQLSEVRDIGIGRRATDDNFDIAMSHNTCTQGTTGYLRVLTEGGPLDIGEECPTPIWDIAYTGGYQPFTRGSSPARAVYFESMGGVTEIVSLAAPYGPNNRNRMTVPLQVGDGWISASGGDAVLWGDETDRVSVWNTNSSEGIPLPQVTNSRNQIGIAALADQRYAVARATQLGVEVNIYSGAGGNFGRDEEVDRIDGMSADAVDVAAFRGGFAVFMLFGTSWTVRTYATTNAGTNQACSFEYRFSPIDTEDAELVAYRDGDDLQVLAAVLFRANTGAGVQQLNVEGPRWRNYFR